MYFFQMKYFNDVSSFSGLREVISKYPEKLQLFLSFIT